tara:strand:+ start:506 stop:859 length:354 start_codon:yes stop_codon:yes gene_type:complete
LTPYVVGAAPPDDEVDVALSTLAEVGRDVDAVAVAVDADPVAVDVNETVAELTVTSTLLVGVGIAETLKLVASVLEVEELAPVLVAEEVLETTDVASAADPSWLLTHLAASSEYRSK